jgi:hypothetical protein
MQRDHVENGTSVDQPVSDTVPDLNTLRFDLIRNSSTGGDHDESSDTIQGFRQSSALPNRHLVAVPLGSSSSGCSLGPFPRSTHSTAKSLDPVIETAVAVLLKRGFGKEHVNFITALILSNE